MQTYIWLCCKIDLNFWSLLSVVWCYNLRCILLCPGARPFVICRLKCALFSLKLCSFPWYEYINKSAAIVHEACKSNRIIIHSSRVRIKWTNKIMRTARVSNHNASRSSMYSSYEHTKQIDKTLASSWRGRRRSRSCCWCWRRWAATAAIVFPRPDSEEHHKQYNYQQEYDSIAGPLPGADLVLPCCLEPLGASTDERVGPRDLALNVIELLPLGLHQDGHIQEHLVELLEALLHVFHCIVPLPDLVNGVQQSSPSLLLNGLLQECLTLTCKSK